MNSSQFRVSKSLEDTRTIAAELLGILSDAARTAPATTASIVGLEGDLGAGKTTFVQQLADVLGVHERVTSPTYVILKLYATTHPYFTRVVHIDAYRLQSGADLAHLGWETIVNDPHNLIMLEWPDKVKDILPGDIVKIALDPINDYTRNIEMEW